MYEGIVEAVSKSTGEKQNIPAEWLEHPVLGKDFRLTPSGREQLRQVQGPSENWSLSQLQDHADTLGVDRTGLRSKADTLAAIEAHAAQTAPLNADVPPGVVDDPTADPTPNDPTGSPAGGDTDSKEE